MSGERAQVLRNEDEAPRGEDPDFQAIENAVMETARGRWFLGEYTRRHRSADTATILDALRRIEATIAKPAATSPDAMKRLAQSIADALVELRLVLGGPRPGESAPDRLLRAQSQLNMLEHRLHSFIGEMGLELPAGRPLSKQPMPVQGNLPAPNAVPRQQPPSIPVPALSSYWSSDKPLTPAVLNLPAKSAEPPKPIQALAAPEPVDRAPGVAPAAPMPEAGELRLSPSAAASQTDAPAPARAQPVTADAEESALSERPQGAPTVPATSAAPASAHAPAGMPVMRDRPRPPDPTLRMNVGEKAALFS